MAAEYVLKEGNPNVMLCERGIRTFETAYRFTLDLTAVPVLKELTHLPVIVDPSHAAGRRDLVPPLSLAAAAAGADGIIVEVHPRPRGGDLRRPAAALRRRLRRVRRAGRAGRRGRRQGALRRVRRLSVAVVGVGLIGGSIGLAARERARRARSRGYDPARRRARARRSSAARSRRVRLASPRRVAGADVAFVAAPVRALPGAVREALAAAGAGLRGDRRRLDQARGRRPRSTTRASSAGTRWRAPRRPGVEHARADLFDGATWYLTPTPRTEGMLYERLHRLLADLGARPAAIDADTHDRLMASVSHLPHVLANVLVAQAARALSAEGERLPADRPELPRRHARGGRHRPRSGATSTSPTPTRWSRRSTTRSRRLGEVREALAGRDERRGGGAGTTPPREDRRRLLEADLAGGEVHELRVSVPNRPGVVAEVALALGRAAVNIVDMALYPAADNTTGSIALWIAGDGRRAPRPRA